MREVGLTIGGARYSALPTQRWAIWHLTDDCNLECGYCYGSFDGSSYKKDFDADRLLREDIAVTVLAQLEECGFEYVHINGGEPLLHAAIERVLLSTLDLSELRVWLLTNGTVRRDLVRRLLLGEFKIERLCFSIDSFDVDVGDAVRGGTRALVAMMDYASSLPGRAVPIGAYVVLTRASIADFDRTVARLAGLGVDYVNLQPVFVPDGHVASDLVLSPADHASVMECYDILVERGILTSHPEMQRLASASLGGLRGVAVDCFADLGDYVYVTPSGVVYGCPSKPSDARISKGSLGSRPLSKILARRPSSSAVACPHLCADCLGMYEMALGPAGAIKQLP